MNDEHTTTKEASRARKLVPHRVRVRTHRYGTLRLRKLTTNGRILYKDGTFLRTLLGRDIPAREVTVRVIHHHLLSSNVDLECVQAWPDKLLVRVATLWMKGNQELASAVPENQDFHDGFKQALLDFMQHSTNQLLEHSLPSAFAGSGFLGQPDMTLGFIRSALDRIREEFISPFQAFKTDMLALPRKIFEPIESIIKESFSFSQILQRATPTIDQLLNFSLPKFELRDWLPKIELPSLSEVITIGKQLKEGGEAFEQSGYGFSGHMWSVAFLFSIVKVNPKSRKAVITKKLFAETRNKSFEDELNAIFQSSSILHPRWKLVLRALEAHRDRDYLASIPMLLTQAEGLYADALRLTRHIAIRGQKIYARDARGNIKLTRNSNNANPKPVELHGIGQLVNHFDFRDHETLSGVARTLSDQKITRRNAILHGRYTAYSSAKLSTQLVLIIYILADEIVSLKAGQTITTIN